MASLGGLAYLKFIHILISPKKITSYSRLTSLLLIIVKLGHYIATVASSFIIFKLLYGIVVILHTNDYLVLY